MLTKMLWFLAFVSTGTGLLVLSLFNISNAICQIVLLLIGFLFFIGLTGHFRELQGRRK
ncbi:hypothetical protein [Alkaliphilus sp. B6464]|uniref:hypothetical protein n=1 Tax=Alkaliphilus sp. B6464 TaxID=2731219 RepID=UPI001BAB0777|nr:hypothetical protein [Alkaliphilus sp. B6464]QUH18763.1 hypothetical protein HYG84_01785 [Alkaliphilus sp. B6464]